MEKLKTVFVLNQVVFAINDAHVFLEFKKTGFEASTINNLPQLSLSDTVFVAHEKLVVINSTALKVFSIKDNFNILYHKNYKEGINLYDTTVINHFICLYLNNDSCYIIDLNSFVIKKFSISGYIFNTNGVSIIDSNIKQSNALIYRAEGHQERYIFDDLYLNPTTNERESITIEKVINAPNSDGYIIQSKYDYIYKLNIEDRKERIQKVVIENTYLGDTVYLNHRCYHITNQNIYSINWNTNEAQLVLNWVAVMDYIDYSGVVVLQTYGTMIVFLATKRGTVVFYSTTLNKIVAYNILNTPFYVNCKHIMFNKKLHLIDSEGLLQTVSVPEDV